MITYFYNTNTNEEAYTLPTKWIYQNSTVLGLTEDNMASFGWEKRTRESAQPDVPPVLIYSRYKIMKALENLNLWEQVKEAIIQANKWDSLVLANELSSDNEDFLAVKNLLEHQFELDADDILSNCLLD